MLTNMVSRFDASDLFEIGRGTAVPMVSMLLGYFAARILAGLVKVPTACREIFIG
ncbi:MAG: hypothetical protein LUF25_04485 [Phascolarctobacterium sp.]|nr:hypothetical protein [Phascolarctobacterium sp.]